MDYMPAKYMNCCCLRIHQLVKSDFSVGMDTAMSCSVITGIF
jgi:hypothetical protein